MKDPKAPYEASARSPFAGCAIFIAAVVMLIFIVGFSIYSLFKQSAAIEKFTSAKAIPVQTVDLKNAQDELNDLTRRLDTFRNELSEDRETSLALSPRDLNLAIASHDEFKELKETFYIDRIENNQIYISISFGMNGKPRFAKKGEPGWVASDSQYLNGTMVAHPELYKKEIVLKVDDIKVPNATVAPQFIDQMSPYRVTERYLTHPVIGPTMAKLTRVKLDHDHLILYRNPKESPADMITNAQVDSASNRLFVTLGIIATAFLVFAGIVVFIGLRSKARNP